MELVDYISYCIITLVFQSELIVLNTEVQKQMNLDKLILS